MKKRIAVAPDSLAGSPAVWIVGLDLAWGERNADGICLIHATRRRAKVVAIDRTVGDQAMLDWMSSKIPLEDAALVLVDAPLVMTNQTGSRAVDRLTHQRFHREHAGCYPANLGKCPRPFRIGQLLGRAGYVLGWHLGSARRLASEVYPHPAMVRLFQLDRIIKYKKGAVTQKRVEFARLQKLLRKCLADHFPQLRPDDATHALLESSWTKPIEDQTDALFCALIGYHHWLHLGEKSETLGDLESGFILLPAVV